MESSTRAARPAPGRAWLAAAAWLFLAVVGTPPAAGLAFLHCADYGVPPGNDFYTMPELLDKYAEERCGGYPRGFKDLGMDFGEEGPLGIDLRDVAPGGSVCGAAARAPGQPLGDFYSDEFPMASYRPGQRVCLVYPSRNHRSMEMPRAVATEQGRALYGTDPLNLPDGGMYVLASPRNPSRDRTIEDLFDVSAGGLSTPKPDHIVAFLGESAPGADDMRGFSNCPAFGINDLLAGAVPDAALGTDACGQCFILPPATPPGLYTFHWLFRFNNKEDGFGIAPGEPDEDFLTCFDVRVEEAAGAEPACRLAGDDGGYPGNIPGTGRHAGEFSPAGYTVGGPIDPASVVPCGIQPPANASVDPPAAPAKIPPPITAQTGPGDSDPTAAKVAVHARRGKADPAEGCAIQRGILFPGAPLDGRNDLVTDGPLDCCAACAASPDCNTFAHCPTDADPSDCPPGECRLMRSASPPTVNFHAPVGNTAWASGTACRRGAGRRRCGTPTCHGWVEAGSKRPGANATFNDAGSLVVDTPEACCAICEGHSDCRAWTMDRRTGACALKAWAPGQVADANYYSGVPNSDAIAGDQSPGGACPVEPGVDFPGEPLETDRPIVAPDAAACCAECEATAECYAWSRDRVTGECLLKGRILGRVANGTMDGGTAL